MNQAANLDSGRPRNRLRPFVWGAAACLLLLPALAMWRGAPGVDWSAGDFLAMGALLAAACGLYELGAWASGNIVYRAGFGLAVLTGFLTVWVNLAVGMLGDAGNPANGMFVGVLLVAAAGARFAGLKSRGMARAMVATALAQLVVAVMAVAMEFEARDAALTACFALPWLAAAWLFRKATKPAGT